MRISGWKIKKALECLDIFLDIARRNHGKNYFLQKMIADSINELTPIKRTENSCGGYSEESMIPGRPIFIFIPLNIPDNDKV